VASELEAQVVGCKSPSAMVVDVVAVASVLPACVSGGVTASMLATVVSMSMHVFAFPFWSVAVPNKLDDVWFATSIPTSAAASSSSVSAELLCAAVTVEGGAVAASAAAAAAAAKVAVADASVDASANSAFKCEVIALEFSAGVNHACVGRGDALGASSVAAAQGSIVGGVTCWSSGVLASLLACERAGCAPTSEPGGCGSDRPSSPGGKGQWHGRVDM